jgi:hypothetical protein
LPSPRRRFQAALATPSAHDIYSVSINGGATTPLFASGAEAERAPTYSPDGTLIAFLADFALRIGNSDGSGTPAPVAIGALSPGGGLDWAPAVAAPEQGGGGVSADTEPPDTSIAKAPDKKTKKRRATIEFASSEPGSSFECVLDGKQEFKPCVSPLALKVRRGRHVLQVRATDPAGNADPSPASAEWKVKRKRPK